MIKNNVSPGATTSLVYRPDIDGLRAIAVLSVLMFHAFPTVLPGGFVGVDIFFVISGFLITGILTSEMQAGRFSILTFYERRIRRIFPALGIVMLFTFAAGWAILYTDELQQLGKDIAAGAAFVANLALWSETGYFDRAAETKPLLHLWSLGVEEQFYIVWPLILTLAHRRRALFVAAVSMIFVASFAANVVLVGHHPGAAFFSPFTRFWELMVGSALALGARHPLLASRTFRNASSLSGSVLCAIALLRINGQTDYPGWAALLPTAGAALLLAGNFSGAVNRVVLSNPLMVWIGKISYPLYLWHWPLLSFSAILLGQTPNATARGVLLLVSVLLAWLTYRILEIPVRRSSSVLATAVLPCLLLVAVGVSGYSTFLVAPASFSKPYSRTADVATATHGAGKQFISNDCGLSKQQVDQALCAFDTRDKPVFAMIGDSKAEALIWGFVRESKPGERWEVIDRGGCSPFIGIVRTVSYAGDDPEDCARFDRLEVQRTASDPAIKAVVIVAARRIMFIPFYANAGTGKMDPQGPLHGMDGTIRELERAGKKVVLVVDNPTLPDPTKCMERSAVQHHIVSKLVDAARSQSIDDQCTIPYKAHLETTKDYRAMISTLQTLHPQMIVYDPTSLFCDIKAGTCPISGNGSFLYSYGDHMSDYANTMVARQLIPIIEDALR
jgi:peptidoglycan/LPS O-acetylase OafA/YrhL